MITLLSALNRSRQIVLGIVAALLILLPSPVQANPDGVALSAATSAGTKELTIGIVSRNPKKAYPRLTLIAAYAAAKMHDLGVQGSKVIVAKDNAQMIAYLHRGEVDWVTETAFSALEFQRQAEAELLLRKWKKGVAQYHTVFITRKDSGIEQSRDLVGNTIAFEDRGSTSSFLIPAGMLLESGMDLVRLAGLHTRPAPEKVGYLFSGGEINLSYWVYRGVVQAAAYSNLDWEDAERTPLAYRNELKIFYRSEPVPRALEIVSKALPPRFKRRLKQILLNAHRDETAKAALAAYHRTARFDELNTAIMRDLAKLQALSAIVQSGLE